MPQLGVWIPDDLLEGFLQEAKRAHAKKETTNAAVGTWLVKLGRDEVARRRKNVRA